MSLKRLGLIALLLLGLPMSVYAQDATAQWEYPAFGLTFDYPSDWTAAQQQGFDFLLVESADKPEEASFVGLQSALLGADDTMQGLFDQFAESYSTTVNETTFGGVPALSLDLPADDSGRQALLIGFQPDSESVALLIFSALATRWEDFTAQIDATIASASVVPLELDVAALDSQLAVSFENNQSLQLGDPDAPVYMLEVMDFSCGHCVEYARSIGRVVQDYVVTGKVRLEFKYVTFVGGELSQTATHAQFCAAEQGVGWQAHEALMGVFVSKGGAEGYTADNINAAFVDFIPDAEAFGTCMTDKPFADLITSNVQDADELGVESTPSLLFATGAATPEFIKGSDDAPVRGGINLLPLYDYLDGLLDDAG